MSGRGQVTWKTLYTVCKAKGVEVETGKGGEKKLVGPTPDGGRTTVRIGHNCCQSRNATVYLDYVKRVQRAFGITDDEIYGPTKSRPKQKK